MLAFDASLCLANIDIITSNIAFALSELHLFWHDCPSSKIEFISNIYILAIRSSVLTMKQASILHSEGKLKAAAFINSGALAA